MNNTKNKKRCAWLLVISALLITGVAVASAQQVVEAIVAIVNDEVITLSEYRFEYNGVYENLRAQVPLYTSFVFFMLPSPVEHKSHTPLCSQSLPPHSSKPS